METKTLQFIQQKLEELLEKLGFSAQVTVEVGSEESVVINLNEKEEQQPLGLLIGYHGETLRSLQLVLSLIVNKGREKPLRLLVDVGGYRKAREESLRDLAQAAVERVKVGGEPYEFRPMNASDRRAIHLYVSSFLDLSSESVGEGFDRRVVISRIEPGRRPAQNEAASLEQKPEGLLES